MDTTIFFLFLFLIYKYSWELDATDEKPTSSPRNEVCDLDSSCSSTTDLPVEVATDKVNVSTKWKYNVSDEIAVNETTDVVHINETNSTVFEIDLTPRIVNRSALMNESKPITMKYQIHLEDECLCDLTKGGCDMNCCCDRDCLHVNRNVFKNCSEVDGAMKNDFCPSKILDSPLLCIVKDNLYSRHFYPQHKMTPEPVNVDKLLKTRNVYGWSLPSLPPEVDIEYDYDTEFQEYDFGSPIWIFVNNSASLEKLKLPKATIMSRDCGKTEQVNFLENYEETCTHRVRSVSAAECEHPNSIFSPTRYANSFSVITNPSLMNHSLTLDCSYNCVNITPFICDNDDTTTCKLMNVSVMPSFTKANVCQHAVTRVHYNFLHNGTEGILAARVYFEQEDIVLKPNLLRAVTFKLTHQWFNQTRSYELSGYPGYVFGKPIIMSFKVANAHKENRTQYTMQMHHQRKRWLTFFKTRSDGDCMRTHRENVLFDENVYTHCFVKVSKIESAQQCENFQNEIINVIFGPYVNVSNAYVSMFGDPKVNDSSKWVPFVVNFPANLLNESCSGLVTAVKIIFLYALVGDHNNPQRSIVAIKVTGNAFDRSVHNYEKVKVSFAVNFYDVTNPPLRVFAEPPTYEVKLPTDFFYPFFSKGSGIEGSKLLSALLYGSLLYANYVFGCRGFSIN